jgi:2-polyprenyl-3-methyl-5-hydroxy-6-metoxy-1,4-benzoquinol methylase
VIASGEDLCLRSSHDFRFMRRDLETLLHASGAHLDVGCSTGGLLEAVAQRFPGIALSGCDLSGARIAQAAIRVPAAALAQTDANEPLPYSAGVFDTVTCLEVVEHLDSPVRLLREISRVLKLGGKVMITTPNANALMRKIHPHGWYALSDPSHLLFFTRFTLSFALSRVGLTVERSWTNSLTGVLPYDLAVSRLGLGGQLCVIARKNSQ